MDPEDLQKAVQLVILPRSTITDRPPEVSLGWAWVWVCWCEGREGGGPPGGGVGGGVGGGTLAPLAILPRCTITGCART